MKERYGAAMEDQNLDSPGADDVLDFVSSITDSARFRIEENLPHGFVRLKIAEAERRQAIHDIQTVEDMVTELVRNSRDAGARDILVGFQKERGRYRRLVVSDDGRGIPEEMHELVFEPRVTSKSRDFELDRYGVHGRGMALFSISSRAEEARVISSDTDRGAVIAVSADTEKVPEHSDQAAIPRVEIADGKVEIGAGPHNVRRVLAEISIDSPEIDIYIGSFAEVLATMRELELAGRFQDRSPLFSELARIEDARALAERAGEDFGLPISERNAYRILNREVASLKPVSQQVEIREEGEPEHGEEARGPHALTVAHRHRNPLMGLNPEDIEEIGNGVRDVVEGVLEKYYLGIRGKPKLRKGRGKISISFHVEEEDV